MDQLAKRSRKAWIYKAKCGKFYRRCTRGSWSQSLDPAKPKELLTGDVFQAEQWRDPMEGSPYLARCLEGGEWIQVTFVEQAFTD